MDKTKLGFGAAANVNSAIADGTLDSRDLIITSDTHEFMYVDDSGKAQPTVTRNKRFNSTASALVEINSATDSYLGQTIMVLDVDTNKYVPYLVQQDPEDGTRFVIEKMQTETSGGFEQVDF